MNFKAQCILTMYCAFVIKMKKLLITYLCITFIISSCSSIPSRITNKCLFHPVRATYVLESAVMHIDTLNDKEVIYLPMSHIGKKEDFDKIRNYLDMKKEQGFTIFYEGILPIESSDYANLLTTLADSTLKENMLLQIDTMRRKMRRVQGFALSFSQDQHTDSLNKSLKRRNKNFVTQSNILLGLPKDYHDTQNEYRVDMTYPGLISRYEKEYKPIVLTKYDWETPLNAEYHTIDTVKHNSYLLEQEYRNEYIAKRVIDSDCEKIVMLYGAGHYWFIWAELRDAGYVWNEEYRAHKDLARYEKN